MPQDKAPARATINERKRKLRAQGKDTPEALAAAETTPPMTHEEIGAVRGRAHFRLSDEVYAKVIQYVSIGSYLHVACMAAGINQRTMQGWVSRGRNIERQLVQVYGEDHEFTEENLEIPEGISCHENDWKCWRFSRAVEKAKAEAEVYAVGVVRKAMPDNWAAAMTFLERTNPAGWRRRTSLDVTVDSDAEETQEQDLLGGEASELVHDALRAASRGELSAPRDDEGMVDGEATEL